MGSGVGPLAMATRPSKDGIRDQESGIRIVPVVRHRVMKGLCLSFRRSLSFRGFAAARGGVLFRYRVSGIRKI